VKKNEIISQFKKEELQKDFRK